MQEYTVKEVADLLGKHEETIKRWIRAGKLPNSYRNSDKEGTLNNRENTYVRKVPFYNWLEY